MFFFSAHMSFWLNLRGLSVEWRRKKGGRGEKRVGWGGSRKWPVRATEGKWRMWRQTDKGREGWRNVRAGWGWWVVCFLPWNAASRQSAAARKSRKTERLFLGKPTCHILAVRAPHTPTPLSYCGSLGPVEGGWWGVGLGVTGRGRAVGGL